MALCSVKITKTITQTIQTICINRPRIVISFKLGNNVYKYLVIVHNTSSSLLRHTPEQQRVTCAVIHFSGRVSMLSQLISRRQNHRTPETPELSGLVREIISALLCFESSQTCKKVQERAWRTLSSCARTMKSHASSGSWW